LPRSRYVLCVRNEEHPASLEKLKPLPPDCRCSIRTARSDPRHWRVWGGLPLPGRLLQGHRNSKARSPHPLLHEV